MASVARPTRPRGGSGNTSSNDPQAQGLLARAVASVDRHWRWALGVLLLLDGALLLYMGRGLTFFYDDWDFVTHDYGGGLHSLLVAHVGNISVFPIAVYKALFHLVGLDHYGIFRLVVVVLHLISAGLIYTLASRRIAHVPALLATALILFLGAAWEDLLWAFQTGYLLSITGGLAAWVLLERRDRAGNLLAMVALVVAVGSSSLGIPLVIGVAVELAWRREWGRGWVVVVPAVLYLAWYLQYGESEVTSNSLISAPGFAADLAAAAAGALVGRALEWGRPLALIGLLVLLRRLISPVQISARLAGLLATGAALWIVTATARSTISPPETSRYVYLGAVVIVLIGVELLRGVELSPRAAGIGALVVAFCAVTGLTVMHAGAVGLRSTSKIVAAELGAMEEAAAYVPTEYRPDPQRAPQIVAGPYLHTVRAIGSTPADSPTEIERSDAVSRAEADRVLLALHAPALVPVASRSVSSPGSAPTVSTLTGGSQTARGGCAELRPLDGATMSVTFALPSGGLAIRDQGVDPVAVAVKRFGDAFSALPAPLPARSAASLLVPRDRGGLPWHAQLSSRSTISLCTTSK